MTEKNEEDKLEQLACYQRVRKVILDSGELVKNGDYEGIINQLREAVNRRKKAKL